MNLYEVKHQRFIVSEALDLGGVMWHSYCTLCPWHVSSYRFSTLDREWELHINPDEGDVPF